jgi:molybdopterin synthase catalytic subunit
VIEIGERFEDPVGDDWIAVAPGSIPVSSVLSFVERPDCGGIAVFIGVVRDHTVERTGVIGIEYEAYEPEVLRRLTRLGETARVRWPELGRLAILHRIGRLEVGDAAVVVAVGSAHRDEAFLATRWCIDTLKTTVPIWKRELFADGAQWGVAAAPIREIVVEPPAAEGSSAS